MKMNDIDGKEQELLIKQVIRKFMKDQLDEQKKIIKESNNSFVFLENSTLNMLITYMLMNGNSRTYGEMKGDENVFSHVKILEELDQIIGDSKQEFEEIITILKEKV